MAEHGLAFFADGIPLNLRWLLPTNEYCSLETYWDGQVKGGGVLYAEHQQHWQYERLNKNGYAAYENIPQRLSVLLLVIQTTQFNPGR